MEGRSTERAEVPATRRIQTSGDAERFFRILREVDRGEWRLDEWAEELGISEDEMMIEVDRHLHRPIAA